MLRLAQERLKGRATLLDATDVWRTLPCSEGPDITRTDCPYSVLRMTTALYSKPREA